LHARSLLIRRVPMYDNFSALAKILLLRVVLVDSKDFYNVILKSKPNQS